MAIEYGVGGLDKKKTSTTVRQLLEHRSGLPDALLFRRVYVQAVQRRAGIDDETMFASGIGIGYLDHVGRRRKWEKDIEL